MCDKIEHSCEGATRRGFLKVAGSAAILGFAGSFVPGFAYADSLTKAQRDKMSPDDVLTMMKKGNERFLQNTRRNRNSLNEQKASASGQFPAAVLLSCIDSRAPAEVIMDLGIGDVFNTRVAGNIENSDVLGGMEFACQLSGAKVVLVMGHTSCGAIKGAVANAELGNLTGLLAKIKPAVAATTYSGARTADNYDFVDAVARKNVEMTVAGIRKNSPVLAALESKGTIKIAGAMYNLKTGAVEFLA
ncbi:MAG: carbonic anhydrase [Betaproteobacteria bacterium]|nr:carbonic anhydrase [Betaproteobacteria bacterium]